MVGVAAASALWPLRQPALSRAHGVRGHCFTVFSHPSTAFLPGQWRRGAGIGFTRLPADPARRADFCLLPVSVSPAVGRRHPGPDYHLARVAASALLRHRTAFVARFLLPLRMASAPVVLGRAGLAGSLSTFTSDLGGGRAIPFWHPFPTRTLRWRWPSLIFVGSPGLARAGGGRSLLRALPPP